MAEYQYSANAGRWIGNLFVLLHQTLWWIPRNNQSINVTAMTDLHLENWLEWADQNASRWFNSFLDLAPDYRRKFISDADLLAYAFNAVDWVHTVPLYQAIEAELEVRRGSAVKARFRELFELAKQEFEDLERLCIQEGYLEVDGDYRV